MAGVADIVKIGKTILVFGIVEQLTAVLSAEQVQVHGPDPCTVEAVPLLHKPEVGIAVAMVLTAEPQIGFAIVDLLA